MFTRKGLAAVAACAAMACAGLVRADNTAPAQNPLTLSQTPLYAAAAAPRRPIMNLLDKAGAAGSLDSMGIVVSGHVEGGWSYNFDNDTQFNNGRVFDFEDQDPTLHQVDLQVEKAVAASGDKFDFGGKLEYMWGGDARLIHSYGLMDSVGVFDGPDEQCDLTQLYAQVNLPVGNGLLLTGGKFVTPLGYEYINPTQNPLYSHSFLFGFAIPFTHTGITAKYNINSEWSIMGGVVRGWEDSLEDKNDGLSYLAQVGYTSGKIGVTLNLITGPEQFDQEDDWRTVVDATVSFQASDELTLAVNGDYGWESDAALDGGDATWYGVAGYAIYKINDMFSLVGRAEYFNDDDGARSGVSTAVYEFTAGVNIHPLPNDEWGRNLVLRPEIRYDKADEDIFNGGDDDSQITFGADVIFML